jgi:hypothetical protein
VVGDVGAGQLLGRHQEYAGRVKRDVAVADDDGAVPGEIEGIGNVVGVSVVPGDEVGRGVAAGQLLPGHPEVAAVVSTHGVEHRVVVGQQVLMGEVAADLDIQVTRQAGVAENGFEHVDDGFGVLMIGCDAGADQAERGRQPFE